MTGVSRRGFLRGASAAAGGLFALQYSNANAQTSNDVNYDSVEDLFRQKWSWDKVVHGTHGTNCTGNCAFNVYVKNGVVWREEQQGGYQASTADTPDYGPRGCQKGLRHHKYMYGPQRILYPMKRVGERGEGKWERITWEQATSEIADKFIDAATEYGVDAISCGIGTQMVVKRSGFASVMRFGTATGIQVPESFAGVGDLPVGVQATLGQNIIGDAMGAVFKARTILIWMCNPAVTRIPDAHFFWEAKYNGSKVIAISPEFTPTAMHANRWVNPHAGTDTALCMSMIHTILTDGTYKADYIKEQTDLPFLIRKDNGKFLRGTDMATAPDVENAENLFYVWDTVANAAAPAAGTGNNYSGGHGIGKEGWLDLGETDPALEGSFTVATKDGDVEVMPVFAKLKERCENEYTPEMTAEITGVNPEVVRTIAREFAEAEPAMIFSGYAGCKWRHGDLLQRSMLMLLSITGNLGVEGGNLQITNLGESGGVAAYVFQELGPVVRVASGSQLDYEHGNMKVLNEEVYGKELADEIDSHYEEAIGNNWIPRHARVPWRMAFFTGENGANWRASGKRWREEALGNIGTIVAVSTDMGTTQLYADYVLPVAHHYERIDFITEPRTPYVQALVEAVPPLGECVDDWTVWFRVTKAIQEKAIERGIAPIDDNFYGQVIQRDLTKVHDYYTHRGTIMSTKDCLQLLMDNTPGLPRVSFDELAAVGKMRVDGTETTVYSEESPYNPSPGYNVRNKAPYPTLTGRQQYYIDHDWFLKFDETLPAHRAPLRIEGYPLQMMMGHARHGIHSMWRDDSLMVALQRGEPDIYVAVEDAKERGVEDGELIKVFNTAGHFIAQAHVSSSMPPGMTFMYHGWDPQMFIGQQNFGAVTSTAGLVKPTILVGDYGHLKYSAISWTNNLTQKDFTMDFEKYVEEPEARAG